MYTPDCGSRKYSPAHFLIICFRDEPSAAAEKLHALTRKLSRKRCFVKREEKSWSVYEWSAERISHMVDMVEYVVHFPNVGLTPTCTGRCILTAERLNLRL